MLVRGRGFTLPELMASIALLGLVTAGFVDAVVVQQRFYTGFSGTIEARGAVRQVADLIPGDVRALSPGHADIYAMGSSFLEYRAPSGASVACALTPSTLIVPPVALASGSALTSWLTAPVAGDSLLLYDEGPSTGIADDQWRLHAIVANTSAGFCPVSSGYTTTTAEAVSSWTLQVNPPVSATTVKGAGIRIFRRSRFEHYLASDGYWYLGHYDCLGARAIACAIVQPVSGPYLSAAGGGLSFVFFDSTGAVTTNARAVSRLDILARARSRRVVLSAGRRPGSYSDSLLISVAVRN